MEPPQTCFYCAGLLQCSYLGDSKGVFVPERVITEEALRECRDWSPVGPQQKSVRESMYGIQGEGCMKVLYSVSQIIMNGLDKTEEGDIDVSEMPDFESMIVDGMTVEDREEQLRYEYDENQNVIVEDGRKRPRPSYDLRKFACDPNGKIGLDHSVGMGWNNDQVIKFILDSEVEQGHIVRPKKTRGGPKQLTKAVGKAAPEETKKMAGEGRRVLINRNKKGGDKKEADKVATPPRRNKAKAAAPGKEAAAEASAPVGELGDLVEQIKVASQETGNKVIDKVNELSTTLDGIHQRLEAIEEALGVIDSHVVDSVTALHDVMLAAGVLTDVDPKLDEEGGILSYIPADTDPE